jgi:hypothetical protein
MRKSPLRNGNVFIEIVTTLADFVGFAAAWQQPISTKLVNEF